MINNFKKGNYYKIARLYVVKDKLAFEVDSLLYLHSIIVDY